MEELVTDRSMVASLVSFLLYVNCSMCFMSHFVFDCELFTCKL